MKLKQLGMTTLGIVLLIVLVMLLFGALPVWPYAHSYGYAPSGLLGLILVVVIILLVAGRL
jgi:hypothetical protein